jgi:hypothetical protein
VKVCIKPIILRMLVHQRLLRGRHRLVGLISRNMYFASTHAGYGRSIMLGAGSNRNWGAGRGV